MLRSSCTLSFLFLWLVGSLLAALPVQASHISAWESLKPTLSCPPQRISFQDGSTASFHWLRHKSVEGRVEAKQNSPAKSDLSDCADKLLTRLVLHVWTVWRTVLVCFLLLFNATHDSHFLTFYLTHWFFVHTLSSYIARNVPMWV